MAYHRSTSTAINWSANTPHETDFSLPMFKIRQLQKEKQEHSARGFSVHGQLTAAQIRLQKDVADLELPLSIQISFPDPSDLFHFGIEIVPSAGLYHGGAFRFTVEISQNFPIDPPKIHCLQKIYHPNIDLDGNVCLNILREDWLPVLSLNSVFLGLNFLFLEPNPNDPLNKDAANVLVKNLKKFASNVQVAMLGGYVDGESYQRVTAQR